jgi:hypothetical protein
VRFEGGNETVNKLDALAFGKLRRALDAIKPIPAIKGAFKGTFITQLHGAGRRSGRGARNHPFASFSGKRRRS